MRLAASFTAIKNVISYNSFFAIVAKCNENPNHFWSSNFTPTTLSGRNNQKFKQGFISKDIYQSVIYHSTTLEKIKHPIVGKWLHKSSIYVEMFPLEIMFTKDIRM